MSRLFAGFDLGPEKYLPLPTEGKTNDCGGGASWDYQTPDMPGQPKGEGAIYDLPEAARLYLLARMPYLYMEEGCYGLSVATLGLGAEYTYNAKRDGNHKPSLPGPNTDAWGSDGPYFNWGW